MISGTGTLVTGSEIDNPKPVADSETVKVVGPSRQGDKIQGGVSREVAPGDVVIIPSNTPDWFKELKTEMVYLDVRVDPRKVLRSR